MEPLARSSLLTSPAPRRLVDWLRPLRGLFPLTPVGMATLLMLCLAYFYGWRVQQDYVLYMVSAAAAGLLVLETLLVGVGATVLFRRLRTCRTPCDLELETDVWQETGFEVCFPRWLPCVELDWSWEVDGRSEHDLDLRFRSDRGVLHEVVRPKRRGLHDHILRRARVHDVLGLAALTWVVSEAVHLRVLPERGNLDRLPLLYTLFQADELSDPRGEPFGDRVDMRQYVRGDPPRMILWKIYARTRKLMVRVPERAITAQPRTCAWLAAGPGDEPGAALARVVLERGMLGDGWRFGADGTDHPASHAQAALEVLARSGNVTAPPLAQAAQNFARYLEQAEQDGYLACLLFAPPDSAAWAETVEATLQRSRVRLYVLVGVDHLGDGVLPPRWKRILLRPERIRPVSRGALLRSVDRWRGMVAGLHLVSRTSGRVVNPGDPGGDLP